MHINFALITSGGNAVDEDSVLNQFIKNLVAGVTFLLIIFTLVAIPFVIYGVLTLSNDAVDENEKKFYKLQGLTLMCLGYALYVFTVILILSNVFNDWWLWQHFPTFWGMFGNWEHQSRMEAVLCDGLTCFVLAPIFFLWSRKYGQLVDGWYFRGRGQ